MICHDCGLVAGDYGCPDCGDWLCADCLTQHDVRHYDASGMAAEDYRECWPADETIPASERSGDDGQQR